MSSMSDAPIRIEVDKAADIRKRLGSRRRLIRGPKLLIVPGVLFLLHLWATRYFWETHNAMYGWPVCYQNLHYLGPDRHSWSLYCLDVLLWLAVSLSVLTVFLRLREARRSGAPLVTLKGMAIGVGVAAVMFALATAERVCDENVGLQGRILRHGRIDFAPGYQLWTDSGLFTGQLNRWLPLRLAVLGFVACYVYCLFLAAEQIVIRICSVLRRLGRRDTGDATRDVPTT